MASYVVLCENENCEAENSRYEDKNGTYWFTCRECGWDNEVVYAGWK